MKRAYFVYFILISCVYAQNDLDSLDLKDLMDMRVSNVASLIPTEARKLPVSSTIITSEMIRNSGARNMMELLEIFVPSYQWQSFTTSGGLDGFRGLMSRRKYLILVNGKNMTPSRISTNFAERLTSLLGDIESIEVIRGPGSAVLGPGAISGIISIKTFSPSSFGERMDLTVRNGFIEDFKSVEFRLGHRFNEKVNMFFYGGMDKYRGVSGNDSPYFSTRSFPGAGITADNKFEGADHNKQSFENQPRYKAHLEFEIGNLTTWLRYTRSGMQGINQASTINALGSPETHETGSQQLSWSGVYEHNFSKFLKGKLSLNYTMDELLLSLPSFTTGRDFLRSSRQDWYQGKAEIFWDPVPQHSFAMGMEYTYFVSGLEAPRADEDPSISGFIPADKWYSNARAVFGEYKYSYSNSVTYFLGGRLDDHSDTGLMFSPKAGASFLLTDEDTLKLVYSRSLRRPAESELRRVQRAKEDAEAEKLDSYEVIYEREINKNNTLSLSLFYYNTGLETLAADFSSESLGRLETAGAELSWKYKSEKCLLIASHSYTDLLNFKLTDSTVNNNESPEPYGGSSDFVNWSPHQSKLYAKYNFNQKLSANGSAVVYWGFPGAESAADIAQVPSTNSDGGNNSFSYSVYVNLGLTYKLNEKITVRGQALNVLGWIEDSYNKRSINGLSEYRYDAPAFILSLDYRF